jgi:hypothetical protein
LIPVIADVVRTIKRVGGHRACPGSSTADGAIHVVSIFRRCWARRSPRVSAPGPRARPGRYLLHQLRDYAGGRHRRWTTPVRRRPGVVMKAEPLARQSAHRDRGRSAPHPPLGARGRSRRPSPRARRRAALY